MNNEIGYVANMPDVMVCAGRRYELTDTPVRFKGGKLDGSTQLAGNKLLTGQLYVSRYLKPVPLTVLNYNHAFRWVDITYVVTGKTDNTGHRILRLYRKPKQCERKEKP